MEPLGTRVRSRPRHTDLKPLTTGLNPYEGRKMRTPVYIKTPSTTVVSPTSTISLATPSLTQVRKYYRDHGLQTALQVETSPIVRNPNIPQENKRRISAISPGGLVSHMESVSVTSPGPVLGHGYVRSSTTLAEKSREMLLKGVSGTELTRLGGLTARRRDSLLFRPSTSSPIAGRFTVDSVHDRLRDSGALYIGDAATADVFINAIQLRRQRGIDEPRTTTASQSIIIIRAKVLPRSKERKPFLMQRRFNLDEMRAASPVRKIDAEILGIPKHQMNGDIQTKKYGDKTSPASSSLTSSPRRITTSRVPSPATSSACRMPKAIPGSGYRRITIMPIHAEYALHYLPVIAALIASGHIRKGDAIELPLPHPEAWQEVVSYIYTGQGRMTRGMEANILYLGGRVD